ncbi:MAG TPA: hypothetical protein VFK02_14275 [Kofleriaceae bacterium]|nr:hypothetical protein [Kofleriaceae bacterium]
MPIALSGGCRSSDGPAGSAGSAGPVGSASPTSPPPVMPASEVKRSQDACKAYVDKVCACADTQPAMKQPCQLARSLPDAMQVALDVAANPESSRRDVVQAHDSVRKIAKECIEQIARLPGTGCP